MGILYLNDITLWTGKPYDREMDAEAHQWLPAIREALFNEDYAKADSLQLHIQGPNSQYYQPLATLHIKNLDQGAVTNYYRELDLDNSICSDRFTRNGIDCDENQIVETTRNQHRTDSHGTDSSRHQSLRQAADPYRTCCRQAGREHPFLFDSKN